MVSADTAVIMFFMTGVAFGCPYSMTQINVVDWINTIWYKKVIRTLLAIALNLGYFYTLQYTLSEQDPVFQQLVYYLTGGFVLYGPFVYICCFRNLLVSPYLAQLELEKEEAIEAEKSQNTTTIRSSHNPANEEGLSDFLSVVQQNKLNVDEDD